MKKSEARSLFVHMMAMWPTILKPGASEAFQRAFVDKIYALYKDFTFAEVYNALVDLHMESSSYPSDHDIKNKIYWTRHELQKEANEPRYEMEYLDADGLEWCAGFFTRREFLEHKRNVNGYTPEEWRQRFLREKHRRWLEAQQEAQA